MHENMVSMSCDKFFWKFVLCMLAQKRTVANALLFWVNSPSIFWKFKKWLGWNHWFSCTISKEYDFNILWFYLLFQEKRISNSKSIWNSIAAPKVMHVIVISWVKSFTSIKLDLCQDINRCFTFWRGLIGTFPWSLEF